ncbi:MAG: hypothetical protein RL112_2378 [Planctomycetota bacterium]
MRRSVHRSSCLLAFLATLLASAARAQSPSGMLASAGLGGGAYIAPLDTLLVRSVDAWRYRSAAIAADGGTLVWDHTGLALRPFGATRHSDVAVGEQHVLALRLDGSLELWCANSYACAQWGVAPPTDLGPVVQVEAGYGHSVVLQADGRARAWGLDDHGQCRVPDSPTPVVAIAAGGAHTLLLHANHELVGFGDDTFGQCSLNSGGVAAIAAGAWHSLAVRVDGSVLAWGRNDDGQCNVPSDLGPCVAVAAGERHSVALRADGTVRAWGWNGHGQSTLPAGVKQCIAIAAGAVDTLYATRDCDGDEVDDAVQLEAGRWQDCDGDLALDACAVRLGVRADINGDLRPDSCEEASRPLCFGDEAACPCGGGAPGSGCPSSSVPEGARLSSTGFSSVQADELLLRVDGLPRATSLGFYQGTTAMAGGMGVAWGDGVRCVTGSILWLGRARTQTGACEWPPSGSNLSTNGRIAEEGLGARYYQVWYRDADPAYCTPHRHNFSNALRVEWVP